MNLQTEPVTKAMAEARPMTKPLNVAPRERVGSHSRHPGLHGGGGDPVCFLHNIVDLLLFRRSGTNDEGPCDVGAIALILRAEIEQQKVSALDYSTRCARVWKRRARSGRDDRRKRRLLAS